MNKIIIFGASRLGEIAYNALKYKYEICFFSDNDKNKWGKEFCKIRIISPNELIQYYDYNIIIASVYYTSISAQLLKSQLKNLYVFSYCDINDRTYKKRYEISKICNAKNYTDLYINEDFKRKFVNDFSNLYNQNNSNKLSNNNTTQNRKILIFAYIFPPIGGAGVQRSLKYVKYLKELGFEPTVVTVGQDFIEEEKDYSLLNEISNDIEIIRIDHTKVNSEQLTKEEVKQNFNLIYGLVNERTIIDDLAVSIKEDRVSIAIPDDKLFWVNDVLKSIESLVDMKEYKYTYTTSSPYATHIIGYYIKNKYKNIKWVADFRDEWSNNPYIKNRDSLKYKIEYEMEKEILNKADQVIQVTPISTKNCKTSFGLSENKVVTITNGYDEDDFKNINKNISKNSEKFVVTYSGTVYKNRLPDNLFIALNELIKENIINKDKIEIRFFGKFVDDTKDIINKYNEFNIIKINGYLAHNMCITENSKSNILLLPIGEDESFRTVYTGKVFEYIRLQIPILALAPIDGVVAELLEKTKTGKTFKYSDLKGIKSFILKHYEMWNNNEKYNEFNTNEIKKYERKELTKKLVDIIKEK